MNDMNLLCKNILLNCLRVLWYYYEDIYYICNECISAIHSSTKISIPFSVYSGGGFFYISARGASVTMRPLSPLPIFWFQVSSGLLRSASNKIPFLAIDQDKNSISENSPQCEQCPKPDNSRPDKASPLPGESLNRNSSLSLTAGLLYGAMLVCNCPKWFYREERAV